MSSKRLECAVGWIGCARVGVGGIGEPGSGGSNCVGVGETAGVAQPAKNNITNSMQIVICDDFERFISFILQYSPKQKTPFPSMAERRKQVLYVIQLEWGNIV
jgi:hypothetical protein